MSKDALHIYAGLTIMLVIVVILRRPIGSIYPLLAVVVVSIIGELFDMRDDLSSFGQWRWEASVHDIVTTAFWPAVLMFLARFRLVEVSDRNGKS